jgi:hypothetical protein
MAKAGTQGQSADAHRGTQLRKQGLEPAETPELWTYTAVHHGGLRILARIIAQEALKGFRSDKRESS